MTGRVFISHSSVDQNLNAAPVGMREHNTGPTNSKNHDQGPETGTARDTSSAPAR